MKNKYHEKDGLFYVSCKVSGTPDFVNVILDVNAFEKLTEIKTTWHVVLTGKKNKIPYVYGVFKNKKVLIHRILMEPQKGEYVDHINRNTLDNRFNNLRLVNASLNLQNRAAYGMSGVKNVMWDKKIRKWKVMFFRNKTTKTYGYFDLINDAEKLAIEIRKETGYVEELEPNE